MDPLLAAAAICAALAFGSAWGARSALRRRRIGTCGVASLAALLMLLSSLLGATLAVGLQGYRALVREDLAATVFVHEIGPEEFDARFVFSDGAEAVYRLQGDQFAVEARILKWHPWANVLGLHTDYALDRVSGRYAELADERGRPRSVFALGRETSLDPFAWRRRVAWLSPVLDAEYGSGTWVVAEDGARYEIRVSTTGLLARRVDAGNGPP